MSEMLKGINNIPVRTWRWLGVNEANVKGQVPEIRAYKKNPLKEAEASGYKITDIREEKNGIKIFDNNSDIGISNDLTELARKSYNTGHLIEAEKNNVITEPVFIQYHMDKENPHVIDNNLIIAEEGSKITVVMKYSSEKDVEAFHNGITKLYAKKEAVINLVKIQLMEDDGIYLDAIAAVAEEGAEINYVLVELGAQTTVTSNKNDMLGNNASIKLYSIYLGDKERQIDINYVMNHYGKECESLIETRGALMDKSSKIFRGTLDFKKGTSGSKGKEEEFAVLLSSGVRNRSVPLLLCGEDNVEGQHAASTGKIDESKLFYLMSRGFSEQEAKKLIIEASFKPIMDRIPLNEVKEEISEYVGRRLLNV
ncbi:Fe-S cluster assembly protein SufD [Clostridium thermarum]|uniref:Fe-S cluster assembly protein SufD n=1 Tax=Clostridium thermarum TaxID=1716543 RepID=UPI00111D1B42|nr:Fe-S cluster assembly protein SufD [Clostridium thermarum]